MFFKKYVNKSTHYADFMFSSINMKMDVCLLFANTYEKYISMADCNLRNHFNHVVVGKRGEDNTFRILYDHGIEKPCITMAAHNAYMNDLRKGHHVNTIIEYTIIGILYKNFNILKIIEPLLAKFISGRLESKWPNLIDKVFNSEVTNKELGTERQYPYEVDCLTMELRISENERIESSDSYLKAMKDDAKEQLNVGNAYYENGEFEKAFFFFSKASLNKKIEAIHQLGTMYYYGQGCIKNLEFARLCFKKGAFYGHEKCIENLRFLKF